MILRSSEPLTPSPLLCPTGRWSPPRSHLQVIARSHVSRQPLLVLVRSYLKAVILALHLFCISQNLLRGYTASQQECDGHGGDPQIKPQRCIADIPLVQLLFFLFGYELGAIDLGPAADTRANQKSYRRVRGVILRAQVSGSGRGHFASMTLPLLRQF